MLARADSIGLGIGTSRRESDFDPASASARNRVRSSVICVRAAWFSSYSADCSAMRASSAWASVARPPSPSAGVQVLEHGLEMMVGRGSSPGRIADNAVHGIRHDFHGHSSGGRSRGPGWEDGSVPCRSRGVACGGRGSRKGASYPMEGSRQPLRQARSRVVTHDAHPRRQARSSEVEGDAQLPGRCRTRGCRDDRLVHDLGPVQPRSYRAPADTDSSRSSQPPPRDRRPRRAGPDPRQPRRPTPPAPGQSGINM